jgi:hypothetical protein
MNYTKDEAYGFEAEKHIFNKVKTKFDIIKNNRYNFFDFRDDTNQIDFELKTRRITKDKYPTIFFAKHKLDYGRKRIKEGKTKRVIYLFCFDKKKDRTKKVLYFWEDDGKDDHIKITMCGNYARGDVAKPLVNLDIDQLKLFKYCPH